MDSLVGYTGFVGSNLHNARQFDNVYNSGNIKMAYGTEPDLLVYSGLRAEKYMANQYPEKDFQAILEAIENIKAINPKKLVLISTIDVYNDPFNVDENTPIQEETLEPYGLNRYYLEKWVMKNYNEYLIVRLPGLYGLNLKKNFIYDFINIIPFMLTENKYTELLEKDLSLNQYYDKLDNGFYKCNVNNEKDKKILRTIFQKIGFSALNFTDSRGVFQFYNLKYLWGHIEKALERKIKVLNLAVEPVQINEIYRYITGNNFQNEILNKKIPNYNFKTIHKELCVKNGYLFEKEFVLEDIKRFVEGLV